MIVLSSRFGVVVAICVVIFSPDGTTGDCSGLTSSIFWNTGSDSMSRVGVYWTIVLKHPVLRCSSPWYSLFLSSDIDAKKSSAFLDCTLLCLPLSVFGDYGLYFSLLEMIDPFNSLSSRLGFWKTGLFC